MKKLTKGQQLVLDELDMYFAATRKLNADNGYCYLNADQMAERVGKSKRTVQRALQALVEAGRVYKVDITGYASLYMEHKTRDFEAARMCFNCIPLDHSKGGDMQTLQLSMYGQIETIHRRKDYYFQTRPLDISEDEIPY